MTRTRFLALLIIGTFLVFNAGFSLCTGCGEERMDCCKAPASRAVQLSEKPCCEVRISPIPETRPAVVGPGGPTVQSPRAFLAVLVPLAIDIADATGIPLNPVIHSPPGIDDLPLFLLNASLRR
jgi:hypothetical protein